MTRLLLLICAVLLVPPTAPAKGVSLPFKDDFEDGTLDAWTISGRQEQGTNIAEISPLDGSLVGHLHKTDYTEINLENDFGFSHDLKFSFDMQGQASSPKGPDDPGYAHAGTYFRFVDAADNFLGIVFYARTTSTWPIIEYNTPTAGYNSILDDAMHSYSFQMSELLAQMPAVNPTDIARVELKFTAYASGTQSSFESMLWVDNVVVTPEPGTGAVLLFGVFAVLRRRVQ